MRRPATWPIVLFVTGILVVLLVAAASWRLLQQERALERERHREQLDYAAGLVIREAERAYTQAASDPRSSLTLRLQGQRVERAGGVPLLWVPVAPQPRSDGPVFAAGEALEFGAGKPSQAIAQYTPLLSNRDPQIRAGAILRIARCQRSLGQLAGARASYAQLAAMGAVPVAGGTAALIGFRERGDREQLKAVLEAAPHAIDRATFDFYSQGIAIDPALLAWAVAVDTLWKRMADSASGTAIIPVESRHFVCTWSRDGARLVDLEVIETLTARSLAASPVQWRFTPGGGRKVDRVAILRKPPETGLPWGVEIGPLPPPPATASAAIPAGLALLSVAILIALYFGYRAVRRELQVAAMQTEFVAAVSHEFRTPITALTHLTELLDSGGVDDQRKPAYYRALAVETRRLRDLVENLLDFGRIEAGRYRYKPEEIDPVELVRDLVAEFRQQPVASSHELIFESRHEPRPVKADREALRRAIWNLLDNAAKYSPAGSPITALVTGGSGWTRVSVEDNGAGIAEDDRKRIFQKFVRGVSGESSRVRGTGIGLAMVDAIARAHGGRVELESKPGRGSRFTILVPQAEAE